MEWESSFFAQSYEGKKIQEAHRLEPSGVLSIMEKALRPRKEAHQGKKGSDQPALEGSRVAWNTTRTHFWRFAVR